MLNKNSKNKDAAAAFLAFVVSKEAQTNMLELDGPFAATRAQAGRADRELRQADLHPPGSRAQPGRGCAVPPRIAVGARRPPVGREGSSHHRGSGEARARAREGLTLAPMRDVLTIEQPAGHMPGRLASLLRAQWPRGG